MNRPPVNILDRPLGGRGSRSNVESNVSLSAFAYLYSELVQYHQNRVDSISELERRLESAGYGVGLKVLELLAYRSRESKREIRLMNILQFISTQVWKALFSKPADSLERSIDHADEFMIVDHEPITSTFVSVPTDFGQLSVDSYMSGIVCGILAGAGFHARVTAHSVKFEDYEHHQMSQTTPIHYATSIGAYSNSTSNFSSSTTSSGVGGLGGVVGTSAMGAVVGGVGPGLSTSSTQSLGNMTPTILPRKEKAVFLVKFSPDVLSRDSALER